MATKAVSSPPIPQPQNQLEIHKKDQLSLNPYAQEFHPFNHHLQYHHHPFPPPPPSVQLPHNLFNANYQNYPCSDQHQPLYQYHHHPITATSTNTTTTTTTSSMMIMTVSNNNTTSHHHHHHLQYQYSTTFPIINSPNPNPVQQSVQQRRFKEEAAPCQNHYPSSFRRRGRSYNNVFRRKWFATKRGSAENEGDVQGLNGNISRGMVKKSTTTSSSSRGRVCQCVGRERKKEEGMVVVVVKPDGVETTAMIRNIPNQYTRGMLMKFLDEFCNEENQKLAKDANLDSENKSQTDDPLVAFDFLYLPIDFKSEANKGYAFVNFTHPNAVWKLHKACNNKGWKHCSSSKICQIAYAAIQGKEKLKDHFGKSRFVCSSEEYLPVCFSPPRDGSGAAVIQTTVGERIPSSSRSRK